LSKQNFLKLSSGPSGEDLNQQTRRDMASVKTKADVKPTDLCPRCAIGRDTNGDGDCAVCARNPANTYTAKLFEVETASSLFKIAGTLDGFLDFAIEGKGTRILTCEEALKLSDSLKDAVADLKANCLYDKDVPLDTAEPAAEPHDCRKDGHWLQFPFCPYCGERNPLLRVLAEAK
jgi:hypothetical protein